MLLIAVWPDTPPGWYHQILNQVNSFLPEPQDASGIACNWPIGMEHVANKC